jgi:hypothetical protein
MGLSNTTFVTIACNKEGCGKTVTFEASQEKKTLSLPENSWVNSFRIVSRLRPEEGKERPLNFGYCSDACEVEGAATGIHNLPEPKRIATQVGTAEQIAAAAAAAKAMEATKALKDGTGITLG